LKRASTLHAPAVLGASVLSALIGAACYGPDTNPRTEISADPNARVVVLLPDRASFDGVGKMLAHSCGTLDCHGQVGRNLRLYGFDGIRLAPSDRTGGDDTTPAELDANFRSVVGLEPEVMSAVVQDKGAHPEWLTLYRKALGLEFHKGNQVLVADDVGDRCFRSWLTGTVDAGACRRAVELP
jgi:hypothetical protein